MKLSTLLWRGALVLAVAAAAGQWLLVQRTQDAAARLVARWVPYGDLHYERLWPWPWGQGQAWGLSFTPQGMLQAQLGTPLGLRLQARELKVRELRYADDGTLERLRGSLIGVQIPVAEQRAAVPESTDLARIARPTLFDLGYTRLNLDLDFDIQYVGSARLAHVWIEARGADLGQARFEAQLEGSPAVFDRAPDQILVRRMDLQFTDAGLLARFKDVSAARAQLKRKDWEAAAARLLETRAQREQWKWDAATAEAARRAIHDSSFVHLRIDPPADVALRNIRLYAVADWPPLLGFSLRTDRDDGP